MTGESPSTGEDSGCPGTARAEALHQQLRQSCRAAHHQVDQLPQLARLMRGPLSETLYRDLLQLFAGVHQLTARRLQIWDQRCAAPDAGRLAALALDLQDLKADPGTPDWLAAALAPFDAAFPAEPADSSVYLGLRYVMDGSSLGGQVIAGRLLTLLPEPLRATRRFFLADPHLTRWQQLWHVAAAQNCDADRAAATACQLFAALRDSFSRCPLDDHAP